MILKSNKEFDIIFIQELSWSFIQSTPSLSSKGEESLVSTSNYPD